ncbi:MAG: chromosome segregation protein SMC [Planctomycetes bacterium]|nr:chromosome segregation protein SMC [Planctomycetota bacterium]
MLKALELVGFKSFADRTRFEFPRGITAVVGPNGSGKSNVVDAIKWVLGEQSVKSLRGKEMADCIFNGSATRSAVNTAETTLVFDNSQRRLAIDTPEVAITRRVYRSGEGEYLINHQPARLRDIRDLFSGTGVGSEAYGIIEQGKVDVLLQSSARDRRMIFEEAAGISRFKAKKIESLRRLERVEQNLLRLSDIVNEVESRLKSIRLQATKARRYQELADRLQQLRTNIAAADWRDLTARLHAIEADVATRREARDGWLAKTEALEAEATQLEELLANSEQEFRQREGRLTQNRQRMAALEAGIDHQRLRLVELDGEAERVRAQLLAMGTRTDDLRQLIDETAAATADAERRFRENQSQVSQFDDELTRLGQVLEQARAEAERLRAAHVTTLRQAAAVAGDIGSIESLQAATQQTEIRHRQRLSELEAERQAIEQRRAQDQSSFRAAGEAAEQKQAELSRASARLVELRQQLSAHIADLNQLQQRHSGARERAALLDELESRLEGVGAGVKAVLMAARGADAPLKGVRGMVADLLRVNVETAPVIDAALGDRAQHLVVSDGQSLWNYLAEEPYRFKGRVSFLRLGDASVPPSPAAIDFSHEPGVVGRADRHVETDPAFAELAERLLGQTWIVRQLADAQRLAKTAQGAASFVTLAAEYVAADGTITVGPRHAGSGLLSRRSELRSLRLVLLDLEREIEATSAAQQAMELRIAAEDRRTEALSAERAQAIATLGEHRARLQAVQAQLEKLNAQVAGANTELNSTLAQLTEADRRLEAQRRALVEAEGIAVEAEQAASRALNKSAQIAEQRLEVQRQATLARVELAASEERFNALRARQQQFEQDRHERQHTLETLRNQLVQIANRHTSGELAILEAESELAELYLALDGLVAEIVAMQAARDDARWRRAQGTADAQAARAEVRKLEEHLHARQLEASQIELQRQSLADRLRDDYGIDLATLEHTPSEDELKEREAVDQEIADLRRKLSQLGNVNLEALGELDELEVRYTGLKAQYEDMDEARRSLAQIIEKINADSRRLFAATLDQVRVYFQTLFRKLFGGGQADIVLEEGVDMLESGIEIVARPPGKEPRNISLLSGGEKTMTCVALLLAIFQYRPSPFCVLDEVDAALDEANIERFVAVLQEFLTWTQFIVVTHSKKTMTCATTLYGVTMQESGVSKRVSVRFEDVSEGGHIQESGSTDTTQAA